MKQILETQDSNGPAVLLSIKDGRATITMNRPERGNGLDIDSVRLLSEAVERVEADGTARVLVLRAKGPRFCVGADLHWLDPQRPGAHDRVFQVLELLNPTLLKLRSMPIVVVAGVQGAVAGGGVGLMVASDLVLAAEGATVKLAYPRIGATPDAGATYFLPRILGERKALELLLFGGDTISTATAHRFGLFNFVTSQEDFVAALESLVLRLTEGPGQALAKTKALAYLSLSNSLAGQLEAERAAFVATADTPDFHEGVRAFLQKRPPHFNVP